MIEAYEPKDPDSTVPRWFDWSEYCTAYGGDVSVYDVVIDDPPDANLAVSSVAKNGNVISYLVNGGTLYETYTLRCRVTLSNGITDDWSKTQTIEQR